MFVWGTKSEVQQTVTLAPGTVVIKLTIRHRLEGIVLVCKPVDQELNK
jgi:hypothetical protein